MESERERESERDTYSASAYYVLKNMYLRFILLCTFEIIRIFTCIYIYTVDIAKDTVCSGPLRG